MVRIADPRRDQKNAHRLQRWIETITYKPEYSFSLEAPYTMIVHFKAPSSRVKGDTVDLRVRVDMPLMMPAAWRWLLLEIVLLIERHETYELLKADDEWVYPPHDAWINFQDDPHVNIEIGP